MEIFLSIIPWILCIILLIALNKQKRLRIADREHARKELKTAEDVAASTLKSAEENAQNKVNAILKESEDKLNQAEARSYAELSDMRIKSEQRIREEREAIRTNKEFLQSLNDKELLIECISALGTYAQRLDRLENLMSNMAIIADNNARKPSVKKMPYIYTGSITDDDLIQIVHRACEKKSVKRGKPRPSVIR